MIGKLTALLACLSLSVSSFAQTLVWKNFTSMYSVNGLAVVQGKVWAADSGGVFSYSPQSGTFGEFTTTDGLSNIVATSIAADSGTAVLVGESNGTIDELNAAGVLIRSQKDITKSSALTKQILSLSIFGDSLFACTPFGVVLISRNSFDVLDSYSHFVPSQGSVQANGTAIFRGNIYVASQYGLSYAPLSGKNLAAPDLWQVINVTGVSSGVEAVAVFNGSLIVGTSRGLYYSYDGTAFQPIASLANVSISGLRLASNSLLVISQNGLFKLDVNNSITALYVGGIPLNDVVAYSDTLIIGATSRGLLLIGSTVRTVSPPGPATNTITHLSVDNSGNLWGSASYNRDVGVAFMEFEFDSTEWTNFTKSKYPELPSDSTYYQISAVCGNRVVVGSWGYGMVLLQSDSMRKYDHSNSGLAGVPENQDYVLVGDATCDPSGNIWIANPLAYNGNVIAAFSPNDSAWYTFNNGHSITSGFTPIAIDAYGGVWTGDEGGDKQGNYHGLFYYNANGTLANKGDDQSLLIDVFNQTGGILSDQVNSVAVDNEDQVWVGTSLGLGVISYPDPSTTFSLSWIFSMINQDVTGIDYDALDDKWVSTVNGVYLLSRDGNTVLGQYNKTNSPLLDNHVNAIACDRAHGIVYFATQYGITQLKTGVVQPSASFAKLKIFPDPARLPLTQPIHIIGLVANSQIKVFSVDGRLVDAFPAQGGNIAYWYGTDAGGRTLPSGVYIIIAYSPDGGQSTVAKVALIKR